MRLSWMLGCLLWAWVCHGLPQTDQVQKNQAKECELYRAQSPVPPVMQFQRRISLGVMPQESIFAAELILQSTTTNRKCQLFFMPGSITLVCGHDLRSRGENLSENLSEGDVTELWMEVAGRSGDGSPTTWDLKVVGRQGKHRAHILIPDTGLQPPVNMWLKSNKSVQYYFNCVTGCLFDKSVAMAPGDHTFFLRHDESFVQMTLDCGLVNYPLGKLSNKTAAEQGPPGGPTEVNFPLLKPSTNPTLLKPSINPTAADLSPPGIVEEVSYAMRKLSINVTAAELGPPGGLKEVTVVWNKQLGGIGVLVDGVPLGGLTDYQPLNEDREVKVKVAEEGGGLVAPCDPHFQMVACGGHEEVTTTTTKTEPSTTTTTSSPSSYGPSTDDASPQTQANQQESSGWLPAVFTFVLLNFIVTVAAISLAVLLYCRSSSNNSQFAKDNSSAPAIFSRRFSTRSSTRSNNRDSQRRKTQNDAIQEDRNDSRTGETYANSETVTTPLTTPDSIASPRKHKTLSTDEFVDLSLM